jgi:hypothetical protein
LALNLRRQYEFPQCGINKGNIYFFKVGKLPQFTLLNVLTGLAECSSIASLTRAGTRSHVQSAPIVANLALTICKI